MRLSIACLALALLFCSNKATFAADADNGLRLAQRWCASCHVVASGQSRGSDAVPTFSSIARREGFNADKLAFFLLVPHPLMPNMSLSRDEARDIAAYIATLRR